MHILTLNVQQIRTPCYKISCADINKREPINIMCVKKIKRNKDQVKGMFVLSMLKNLHQKICQTSKLLTLIQNRHFLYNNDYIYLIRKRKTSCLKLSLLLQIHKTYTLVYFSNFWKRNSFSSKELDTYTYNIQSILDNTIEYLILAVLMKQHKNNILGFFKCK